VLETRCQISALVGGEAVTIGRGGSFCGTAQPVAANARINSADRKGLKCATPKR
jgi:hypothetical protein